MAEVAPPAAAMSRRAAIIQAIILQRPKEVPAWPSGGGSAAHFGSVSNLRDDLSGVRPILMGESLFE
jgi:hypothetical protein